MLLRKVLLIALVAACITVPEANAFDVEVEEEVDEEDEREMPSSTLKSEKSQVITGWDKEGLAKAGMTLLTNELYDNEVYGGARNDTWLIVFLSQLNNTNVYSKHADMNRAVSKLLLDFAKMKASKTLKIRFVDTFQGELLKETFDIETIPSIRFVRADQVYHLKWNR